MLFDGRALLSRKAEFGARKHSYIICHVYSFIDIWRLPTAGMYQQLKMDMYITGNGSKTCSEI